METFSTVPPIMDQDTPEPTVHTPSFSLASLKCRTQQFWMMISPQVWLFSMRVHQYPVHQYTDLIEHTQAHIKGVQVNVTRSTSARPTQKLTYENTTSLKRWGIHSEEVKSTHSLFNWNAHTVHSHRFTHTHTHKYRGENFNKQKIFLAVHTLSLNIY